MVVIKSIRELITVHCVKCEKQSTPVTSLLGVMRLIMPVQGKCRHTYAIQLITRNLTTPVNGRYELA